MSTILRAGFTRPTPWDNVIAGILRDRTGQAVWRCEHAHERVGEAWACAKAELARRREAEEQQ